MAQLLIILRFILKVGVIFTSVVRLVIAHVVAIVAARIVMLLLLLLLLLLELVLQLLQRLVVMVKALNALKGAEICRKWQST